MDERGFLRGHLQKVRRIFPKALMHQQRLLGTGRDGFREWITLIVTIGADESSLPPAMIYKAVANLLESHARRVYSGDVMQYDDVNRVRWASSLAL